MKKLNLLAALLPLFLSACATTEPLRSSPVLTPEIAPRTVAETCDELLEACAQVVEKQTEAIDALEETVKTADETIKEQTKALDGADRARERATWIAVGEGIALLLLLLL